MTDTLKALLDRLEKPGAMYRSVPFWGWNDAIEGEEASRQLEDFKAHGLGGVFIHSREGLETPYLSDEWLDRVEECVKKAKALGLEIWLYDEDKWPSGSAGGKVSALSPDYCAKGLTFSIEPAGSPASITDMQPNTQNSDSALSNVKIIGVYKYKQQSIVLRQERTEASEWYNGLRPTDTLSKEAVGAFIRLTHERYRARVGGEFGGAVKGFFTDEPNCFDFFSRFGGRPWVPWTRGFAEYFGQKRGYDPVPYLPWLFVDDFTPQSPAIDAQKLRHDYWRTVSDRFSEAYMRPLYEWCEQNGVASAGHLLYENDLGYQARVCGAVMPQYRYFTAPSIDILGANTREYLTVKQCASAARQYGRSAVFSETYGCTGWDLSYFEQKRLCDWQFVMGVTRRCQHLALYSISGSGKRDYPPVFNYQNACWDKNAVLEDYFARVSMALSEGEAVNDLLVIHPMSSIWCRCKSAPDENLDNIEMNMGWKDAQFVSLNVMGEEYNRLAEMLLRLHTDFDFGDETILAETGSAAGGRLRVNKAVYKTVLVPRALSLFESTWRLLLEFAEAGGELVFVGGMPERVDGALSEKAAGFAARLAACKNVRVQPGYEALGKPFLSVTGSDYLEDGEILLTLRKTRSGYTAFIINTDAEKARGCIAALAAKGRATLYDPMTARARSVPCEIEGDGMRFPISLEAGGSALLLIETGEPPELAPATLPYVHPHAQAKIFASLGADAECARTLENALTLDECRYSLGGAELSEKLPVWQAQRRIRQALSMPQLYYNGAPQRYTWLGGKWRSAPFALQFEFKVEAPPQPPVYAVIEKPSGLAVTLDGLSCGRAGGWYIDRSFCKFLLPPLARGVHTLELSGDYGAERELEDVYITGSFGVSPEGAVTEEPGRLHFGDWSLQGYRNYPGNMRCAFELPGFDGKGRLALSCEFRAAYVAAYVNGEYAGLLLKNEKLDITGFMRVDANELVLEAGGSPRNLLGPLHQPYNGCSRISWADFRTEGGGYSHAQTLKPFGITKALVEIID